MKTTQTSKGELLAGIQISLLKEDYEAEVTKALKDYQHKATMPGFRQGKVPFGMIKKMYGQGVLIEKINQKVSEALNNHIVENKLDVIGYPLPDMEQSQPNDLDNQEELNFYFEAALKPAITVELKNVCRIFGKEFLRDVDEDEFYANIANVRQVAGDRATLRAMHVFAENKRVEAQKAALRANDFDTFLKYVTESGLSSWRFLQNVTPKGRDEYQEVAFALALSEKLLAGTKGVCRVHGGGFAGTIQAFVPIDMLKEFKHRMELVFGEGNCYVLSIRPVGGVNVI